MALLHFSVMILASFLVFVGIVVAALRCEGRRPNALTTIWLGAVVTIGGMAFAKAGAFAGLPVWLYYGVPAGLTWLLPPVVFRMRRTAVAIYLPLAVLSAPAIHVLFSLLLGWNEYMPFIPVPSLRHLIQGAV